jgi:hypothetical protein
LQKIMSVTDRNIGLMTVTFKYFLLNETLKNYLFSINNKINISDGIIFRNVVSHICSKIKWTFLEVHSTNYVARMERKRGVDRPLCHSLIQREC